MDEASPDAVAWSLESWFSAPEGEDLRAFLRDLQHDLADLEARAAAGAVAGEAWPGLLTRQEDLEARLRHLSAYVYCVRSTEPGDEAAEAALTAEVRVRGALEAIAGRLSVALAALSEEAFERVLADPSLAGLEWRIRRLRRQAASRLAPSEERLAGDLLEDSLHGWSRLAEAVFQGLTFEIATPDGDPTRAPFSQRFDYFWDADPAIRRSAYRGSKRALASVETTLAACLNGMAGARVTLLRHRGLDVVGEATSRMSVSRSTIETMMAALHARREVLQRYLDLKRIALGLSELEVPDRWAPLGSSPRLSPSQALDEVTAAFARVCPPLAEAVRTIRRDRWIDYRPGPDKAGSAFCVDSPLHGEPRVYMNTPGGFMGQTVLAHELGHAYHFMAMQGLRPWRRMPPSTMAETASITAEHLFRAGVLAGPDLAPERRLEVLGSDLDAAVNYLLRIPRDYDFERKIYEERAKGELKAGRLKALAREAHARWFEESFAPDADEYAWASPLLFSTYTNFFNFPYTFGYLLGRRIAQTFEGEGAGAAEAFAAFLRASDSMDAEDAARSTLGFDLTSPAFWDDALAPIEARVEAFAQIAIPGHAST